MENDFQTPMKGHNGTGDGASTIAHGLTEHKGMTESKLQHQGQQTSDRAQQDKRLDEIEREIQQIGQELKNLHYEIQKQPDRYSQEVLSKERFRSQLRKKLIDLDYEHKEIIAGRIRQSRKLQQEKREQVRKQVQEKQQQIRSEREQRQRKRRQELDAYEQAYRQKLREITESRRGQKRQQGEQSQQQNQEEASQAREAESQQKPEGQEQQQSQVNFDNNQKNINDELARSRRRLRIAEIESQLAKSRLQRSRIATLNAELDYLRYSYSDPYYVYRPYSLPPSYYYPYSSVYAYPSYSRLWYY